MKHKKILGLSAFALIFFPVVWVAAAKHVQSKPVAHSVPADVPIVVGVGKVVQKDISRTIPALGSLSAINIVTLSSQSDGRIASINFRNGQSVAKGMPVLQLDDTQAKANYKEQQTAYALAKESYERSEKLENYAVSIQKVKELAAQMKTAESKMDSAFATLEQMKIIAPFSGVLGAFKVNVGDYISAGAPIVTLVNTSQLRVDFNLPESYLPQLKTGQMATISVAAYAKKHFVGTVSFVSPTVQKNTRTVLLQALVSNNKGLLSPGMFVKVQLHVGVIKNVIVVSDQAVMADVKGNYVYKVVGNKASQVYIKVGQREGENVQVLSGLKPGDEVVTTGQQKLDDGSRIQIQN